MDLNLNQVKKTQAIDENEVREAKALQNTWSCWKREISRLKEEKVWHAHVIKQIESFPGIEAFLGCDWSDDTETVFESLRIDHVAADVLSLVFHWPLAHHPQSTHQFFFFEKVSLLTERKENCVSHETKEKKEKKDRRKKKKDSKCGLIFEEIRTWQRSFDWEKRWEFDSSNGWWELRWKIFHLFRQSPPKISKSKLWPLHSPSHHKHHTTVLLTLHPTWWWWFCCDWLPLMGMISFHGYQNYLSHHLQSHPATVTADLPR